jgi:hypothetical protein
MRTMCTALIAVAALLTGSAKADPNYQFFISETTDFTGNGCPNNTDVNTITSTLKTAFEADGWSGTRFVNASAYPQDFFESCSNAYGPWGNDAIYADSGVVSVFAGHGGQGELFFGYPELNKCSVFFNAGLYGLAGAEARLGSMAGARSGFGIYLGCEALKVPDGLNASNLNWMQQQFGFTNIVSIGNNEPRDFYNATSYGYGVINAIAWLDRMDGGGRHPLVSTQSNNSGNCWASHASLKLRGHVGVQPRAGGPSCENGQPSFWYCYETR